jgi:AhpC/TSA family protein
MNRKTLLTIACLAFYSVAASASVTLDQAAPNFTVSDSSGKQRSLAEFKGKTVVLEWNNPECPFVQKHYESGNIPKQQAAATASGVVWLTINSGRTATDKLAAANKSQGGKASAYLLDKAGTVGKLYGAKTTPQLFVIDAQGMLRYMGGIDSIPSSDKEDLAKATQFVPQTLAALAAGKSVSTKTSQPYGCSVKY